MTTRPDINLCCNTGLRRFSMACIGLAASLQARQLHSLMHTMQMPSDRFKLQSFSRFDAHLAQECT